MGHLVSLHGLAIYLSLLQNKTNKKNEPGWLLQGDDNSDTGLVHKFFKSTEVNSRLTARSESAFAISLNLRRS